MISDQKKTQITFASGLQNVCPKGAASFSPGLLGTSYPGFATQFEINPERVGSIRYSNSIEPRQGSKNIVRSSPRVARFAQPWADLLNPVGIRNWRRMTLQSEEVLA